jgi:hypothetical protein
MAMTSWRDVIKVHPAAELFPLMSPEELKALGEDIVENGMTQPITLWYPGEGRGPVGTKYFEQKGVVLLDGRNRLDALEAVGREVARDDSCLPAISLYYEQGTGKRLFQVEYVSELGERNASGHYERGVPDPYAYVISANIHRRHLTSAQKVELIAALLKATPERSDRATAKIAKVSDKTVGAVRERLEATAEIPQLEKRTGADGKARQQPSGKTSVTAETLEKVAGSDKIQAELGGALFGAIATIATAKASGMLKQIDAEKPGLELPVRETLRAFAGRENRHADEKPKTVILESFAPDPAADLPLTADPATAVPEPPNLAAAEAALDLLDREELILVIERAIANRDPDEQHAIRAALAPIEELAEHSAPAPSSVNSDKALKEWRVAEGDRRRLLANIKTLWLAENPRRHGSWEKFCSIELKFDRRQIDRVISGNAIQRDKESIAAAKNARDVTPRTAEAVDKVETVAEGSTTERTDEEILKLLGRTKWVGPAKVEMLGISEEVIERLLATGRLRRHPTTPANIGLPE